MYQFRVVDDHAGRGIQKGDSGCSVGDMEGDVVGGSGTADILCLNGNRVGNGDVSALSIEADLVADLGEGANRSRRNASDIPAHRIAIGVAGDDGIAAQLHVVRTGLVSTSVNRGRVVGQGDVELTRNVVWGILVVHRSKSHGSTSQAVVNHVIGDIAFHNLVRRRSSEDNSDIPHAISAEACGDAHHQSIGIRILNHERIALVAGAILTLSLCTGARGEFRRLVRDHKILVAQRQVVSGNIAGRIQPGETQARVRRPEATVDADVGAVLNVEGDGRQKNALPSSASESLILLAGGEQAHPEYLRLRTLASQIDNPGIPILQRHLFGQRHHPVGIVVSATIQMTEGALPQAGKRIQDSTVGGVRQVSVRGRVARGVAQRNDKC